MEREGTRLTLQSKGGVHAGKFPYKQKKGGVNGGTSAESTLGRKGEGVLLLFKVYETELSGEGGSRKSHSSGEIGGRVSGRGGSSKLERTTICVKHWGDGGRDQRKKDHTLVSWEKTS